MPSTKRKKSPPAGGKDTEYLGPKLIVVGIILALLVLTAFAMENRKNNTSPKKEEPVKEEVLGGETGNPISDVTAIGQETEKLAVNLTENAQKTAEEVLGSVSQTAASFVVENAGNSLLEQIQKLPEKQQSELKQQICK